LVYRLSGGPFCLRYVSGLQTLGTLHDFKFHRIAFLQSSIAVSRNGRVRNENIWTVIPPDEAVAFGVIPEARCRRGVRVKGGLKTRAFSSR